MASVDLGKQVGPLPLGAWVVVVGAGLGIAYFSTRTRGAPVEVEDTSGVPGVGDGSVGGWTPTQPPSGGGSGGGTTRDPSTATTNEEWGRLVIDWLIANNYPSVESDSAIRKYLAGNDPAPSVTEWSLQRIALARWGSPPQPLPPSNNNPPPTPTNPTPTNPPPSQAPPPVTITPPSPPEAFPYQIPFGFVPSTDNGTSRVFIKVAVTHGWPGNVANKQISRDTIDKIWYHPRNLSVRLSHGNNWTTMRMGQWIWVPKPY